MFSYFTITSANEILPKVIDKFKTVTNHKNEIVRIEQELNTALSPGNKIEEHVKIKQKLNSAVTKFYQSIEDLEKTGVVIKGIEEGLFE